jgi:hypothetical protein
VSLLSNGAVAIHGVATVKMTCNLSASCVGAFLICMPQVLCNVGPTDGANDGGRLGASDFVIAAHATKYVGVSLTAMGSQLASDHGGFKTTVLVDMRDYGIVLDTTGLQTGTFSLASGSRPVLPAGATASCGGVVFIGPNATCPLARKALQVYLEQIDYGAGTIRLVDPSTGQTYVMRCTNLSDTVCTGQPHAIVIFYA